MVAASHGTSSRSVYFDSIRILVIMSETLDKLSCSDLDLFVMALIDSGISTREGVESATDLSAREIRPVLQRLTEGGLVLLKKHATHLRAKTKSVRPGGRAYFNQDYSPLPRLREVDTRGPRSHTDYEITPEGLAHLKFDWRALIGNGPSGDLDADLRVALVAFWVSGHRGIAVKFLNQAASKIENTVTNEDPDNLTSLPPLAFWYRRLRVASVEALLRRNSAAVSAMVDAFPKFRPASGGLQN